MEKSLHICNEEMVSIVIPNFNKGAFIKETLDSMLNQKYQDWEAIIVDDGSTDDSIAICEEYMNKDKRFNLAKRERLPKGGSTCRNIGLSLAKGEYIIFVDSDDLLAPDCLQGRVNEIQNTYFDFLVFQINIFKYKLNDSDIKWKILKSDHLACFLKHELPWHTMSCIWRKEFLLKLNGFNEQYPRLQDVEMHTRAVLEENVKYKLVLDREADCYYRIGNQKIISDYNQYIDNWTKGTECYLNFFEKYLIDHKKTNYLSFLKVTLLVMVSQLNYQYQNKHISKDAFDVYYNRLLECEFSKNELTYTNIQTLKIYNMGYKFYLNRIKGYNYMFRKLIQLI